MAKHFVKATIRGQEEQRLVAIEEILSKDRAGEIVFFNSEFEQGAGLRPHRAIGAAQTAELPENVRTVRAYGDCILLFHQEQASGFYEIYALKDGKLTKTGTSVTTYPLGGSGGDYCNSMVATEEEEAGIDQGCTHTKLLFFPSKQVVCLGEDGIPFRYSALPAEVPKFRHATVAKGRLYGSLGQKLYVSGELGCFDWYFAEDPDQSSSAWQGNSMTVSDGGLPITALCSYKDGVLVFRENAMQMIKGDGAPFAVKDLYKTGTANSKSVKEASGILYFISGDRVARYNGNSLSFLPPLPEGTTLPGCAGVLEGKYCFYALQGQRRLLYTYHPEIDAYSVAELFLDVKEFVSCGEKLYMLASEEGKPNGLYCLFEDRTGTVMNAALPMTLDGHTAFAIDSISLRAKAESDCQVTLSVVLTDDEGQTRTVDIGSFFGEAGSAQVFRVKKRLPRAVKAQLLVRTEGDVCLQSYRWQCKKRDGPAVFKEN